uniref:Uncharacterized protein n=1 Tax=Solanum tuberosum TaxID=4113 RepID=M1D7Z7_SOLTU
MKSTQKSFNFGDSTLKNNVMPRTRASVSSGRGQSPRLSPARGRDTVRARDRTNVVIPDRDCSFGVKPARGRGAQTSSIQDQMGQSPVVLASVVGFHIAPKVILTTFEL